MPLADIGASTKTFHSIMRCIEEQNLTIDGKDKMKQRRSRCTVTQELLEVANKAELDKLKKLQSLQRTLQVRYCYHMWPWLWILCSWCYKHQVGWTGFLECLEETGFLTIDCPTVWNVLTSFPLDRLKLIQQSVSGNIFRKYIFTSCCSFICQYHTFHVRCCQRLYHTWTWHSYVSYGYSTDPFDLCSFYMTSGTNLAQWK